MSNELYDIKHRRSFAEFVSASSRDFGNDTAFSYMSGNDLVSVTFAQAAHDMFALGSYFRTIGLENNRIALFGENSYEWIVTYFAAVISGNVIVPLDKELKIAEAASLFEKSHSDMLVYSGKKAALAEDLSEKLSHSLCLDNFSDAVKKGEDFIDSCGIMNDEPDVEKVCTIIFTSGTTGTPKGVMLSQRNLMADAIRSMESMFFPKGTICLLPLNHTFGMMACVITQFYMGFPVFINSGLKYVMRDIKLAQPRHISVVPLFVENFYKSIWKNAKKSGKEKALKNLVKTSNALRKIGIDMRRKMFKSVIDGFGGRLEMIITGGAPISQELIKGFDDFGISVVNGYGITECSPIVSLGWGKNSKPNSIGRAINTVQVKTIDENSDGEGEICVKGDIVMMGYFENPEANNASFTPDGWFKTGDIGRIDEDGFIFITGRKKNLIILDNGKNVYPEELEYLIGRIDGVTEVLVYAEDGMITAEIYSETGDKNTEITDAIKNELNPSIASYKQIHKIKFRSEEFEKTTTRKIKR